MSSRQERQRFIRYWMDQTGEHEIDMHKVALFAAERGWKLPTPPSPIDMLAKLFKDAAREQTEYDSVTGKPYRVYHALPVMTPEGQLSLFVYVDINEAPRRSMLKSAVNRREQMVSDGLQLTFDLDHWNRINPTEEPIALPMDLTLDIDIRKAADDDDKKAG